MEKAKLAKQPNMRGKNKSIASKLLATLNVITNLSPFLLFYVQNSFFSRPFLRSRRKNIYSSLEHGTHANGN